MNLAQIAKQAGFGASYLLPVPQYEAWTHRRASGAFAPQADYIEGDAARAYPWADGLWLLIWPYAPLETQAALSGYYFASHQSYHAMQACRRALEAEGLRGERAAVPVKPIMEEWGIGCRLDNDLIFIPGFGTRFVVQALMVALGEQAPPFAPKKAPFHACIHCRRCQEACPGGAIQREDFRWQRCLRAYEEGPDMPLWVREKLNCLLGCEACQAACPLNHPFPPRPLRQEEAEAFQLSRLIQGDVAAALALVGKNMKKGGKLPAQAAVLAANQKRKELLPLLEAQAELAQGPLKDTFLWAISHLKTEP